ncbi:MAG: SgcJ/EcaC family oxidoreductase [Pirellulaceae bacterium]
MIRITIVALLIAISGAVFSQAKDKASRPTDKKSSAKRDQAADDLAAIRAESQAFVAAFNKKDAKAVAALWTEDGEYLDDAGRTFAGRQAIEKGYADFFAAHGKAKIDLRVMIDSLRLLGPNAAIEEGRAVVEPAPQGSPGVSKYTVFHTKVDGKWLMASVRDTWVESPSAYQNIADLEWLIGEWSAEEHGAKHESVCRWVGNKSFVERKHTVAYPDQTTSSGVQIIGFNPQRGHVQSWDFTTDGGHAVGAWTPHENGWRAEVVGMLGDGTPTRAINVLTRIDDNAYVWQSIQRTAGDVALPDSDEIVIKRQPPR